MNLYPFPLPLHFPQWACPASTTHLHSMVPPSLPRLPSSKNLNPSLSNTPATPPPSSPLHSANPSLLDLFSPTTRSVSNMSSEFGRRVWTSAPPPQRPFRVCDHKRTTRKGLTAATRQELLDKVSEPSPWVPIRGAAKGLKKSENLE